jgi:hypothetical protein
MKSLPCENCISLPICKTKLPTLSDNDIISVSILSEECSLLSEFIGSNTREIIYQTIFNR